MIEQTSIFSYIHPFTVQYTWCDKTNVIWSVKMWLSKVFAYMRFKYVTIRIQHRIPANVWRHSDWIIFIDLRRTKPLKGMTVQWVHSPSVLVKRYHLNTVFYSTGKTTHQYSISLASRFSYRTVLEISRMAGSLKDRNASRPCKWQKIFCNSCAKKKGVKMKLITSENTAQKSKSCVARRNKWDVYRNAVIMSQEQPFKNSFWQ